MTTKKKLHSFVIPAHKDSPYIEECIQSLLNQTMESEIVITTSTPSTFIASMSKKYQIPLILNNHSNGIGADWSFAYCSAKTKYVTLAHQDDTYFNDYTKSCLSAAEKKQKETLIIFSDYKELKDNKFRTPKISFMIKKIILLPFNFQQSIRSPLIKKFMLSFSCPISCPSVMFNKEYIGSFEFSRNFFCVLDWEAWLKLAQRKGSFVYVKKKLIMHRIHNNAQSYLSKMNNSRKIEERVIFENLWPKPIAKILANIYYYSSKF